MAEQGVGLKGVTSQSEVPLGDRIQQARSRLTTILQALGNATLDNKPIIQQNATSANEHFIKAANLLRTDPDAAKKEYEEGMKYLGLAYGLVLVSESLRFMTTRGDRNVSATVSTVLDESIGLYQQAAELYKQGDLTQGNILLSRAGMIKLCAVDIDRIERARKDVAEHPETSGYRNLTSQLEVALAALNKALDYDRRGDSMAGNMFVAAHCLSEVCMTFSTLGSSAKSADMKQVQKWLDESRNAAVQAIKSSDAQAVENLLIRSNSLLRCAQLLLRLDGQADALKQLTASEISGSVRNTHTYVRKLVSQILQLANKDMSDERLIENATSALEKSEGLIAKSYCLGQCNAFSQAIDGAKREIGKLGNSTQYIPEIGNNLSLSEKYLKEARALAETGNYQACAEKLEYVSRHCMRLRIDIAAGFYLSLGTGILENAKRKVRNDALDMSTVQAQVEQARLSLRDLIHSAESWNSMGQTEQITAQQAIQTAKKRLLNASCIASTADNLSNALGMVDRTSKMTEAPGIADAFRKSAESFRKAINAFSSGDTATGEAAFNLGVRQGNEGTKRLNAYIEQKIRKALVPFKTVREAMRKAGATNGQLTELDYAIKLLESALRGKKVNGEQVTVEIAVARFKAKLNGIQKYLFERERNKQVAQLYKLVGRLKRAGADPRVIYELNHQIEVIKRKFNETYQHIATAEGVNATSAQEMLRQAVMPEVNKFKTTLEDILQHKCDLRVLAKAGFLSDTAILNMSRRVVIQWGDALDQAYAASGIPRSGGWRAFVLGTFHPISSDLTTKAYAAACVSLQRLMTKIENMSTEDRINFLLNAQQMGQQYIVNMAESFSTGNYASVPRSAEFRKLVNDIVASSHPDFKLTAESARRLIVIGDFEGQIDARISMTTQVYLPVLITVATLGSTAEIFAAAGALEAAGELATLRGATGFVMTQAARFEGLTGLAAGVSPTLQLVMPAINLAIGTSVAVNTGDLIWNPPPGMSNLERGFNIGMNIAMGYMMMFPGRAGVPSSGLAQNARIAASTYMTVGSGIMATTDIYRGIKTGDTTHFADASTQVLFGLFGIMQIEHTLVQGQLQRTGVSQPTRPVTERPQLEPFAYRTMGDSYLRSGKLPDAIANYTLALERVPNDANALYGRANAYFRAENYNGARADLVLLLRIGPNANAQQLLGLCMQHLESSTMPSEKPTGQPMLGSPVRGVVRQRADDFQLRSPAGQPAGMLEPVTLIGNLGHAHTPDAVNEVLIGIGVIENDGQLNLQRSKTFSALYQRNAAFKSAFEDACKSEASRGEKLPQLKGILEQIDSVRVEGSRVVYIIHGCEHIEFDVLPTQEQLAHMDSWTGGRAGFSEDVRKLGGQIRDSSLMQSLWQFHGHLEDQLAIRFLLDSENFEQASQLVAQVPGGVGALTIGNVHVGQMISGVIGRLEIALADLRMSNTEPERAQYLENLIRTLQRNAGETGLFSDPQQIANFNRARADISELIMGNSAKGTEGLKKSLGLTDDQAAHLVDALAVLTHLHEGSGYTAYAHSLRVASYTREFVRTLVGKTISGHTITAEDVELIVLGALIHDIGKSGVAHEHLRGNPSTPPLEGRRPVEPHIIYGEEIIIALARHLGINTENNSHWQALVEATKYHHEWWSGKNETKNYPRGSKGDQIPFIARVVAVLDVLDASTAPRFYQVEGQGSTRAKLTLEKAVVLILADADKGPNAPNTHFDPALAKWFKGQWGNGDTKFAKMIREIYEQGQNQGVTQHAGPQVVTQGTVMHGAYVGAERILLETENMPERDRGYYVGQYNNLVDSIAEIVAEHLKGREGMEFTQHDYETFMEQVWSVMKSNFNIEYGQDQYGFLYSSRDLKKFDCDNSAFLVYDVAMKLRAMGFRITDVKMVEVPGHALLTVGNSYFETTTGHHLPLETMSERYPVVYLRTSDPNEIKAMGYSVRANSYFSQGDYTRALQDYDTAIGLNHNNPSLYRARARVFEAQGNQARQLEDLNTAIGLNPRNAVVFCDRGLVYEDQGNTQDALKDYTTAIELNQKNDRPYKLRASLLTHLGRYKEALQDNERLFELNPSPFNYELLGTAYYNAGEYLRAALIYRSVIDSGEVDASTYLYRGLSQARYYDQLCAEHGEFANKDYLHKAIDDFTEVINNPSFTGEIEAKKEALKARAECYRKLGMIAEAEKDEEAYRHIK